MLAPSSERPPDAPMRAIPPDRRKRGIGESMTEIELLRIRLVADEAAVRVTRAQLAFAEAVAEHGILALDDAPERAELNAAYKAHAEAHEPLMAAYAERAAAAEAVSP